MHDPKSTMPRVVPGRPDISGRIETISAEEMDWYIGCQRDWVAGYKHSLRLGVSKLLEAWFGNLAPARKQAVLNLADEQLESFCFAALDANSLDQAFAILEN